MIRATMNILTEAGKDHCLKKLDWFEEEGLRVELPSEKNEEVCVLQIDGCVIKHGERCDCAFLLKREQNNKNAVFLVELKGSRDYLKAVSQLLSTVKSDSFQELRRGWRKFHCREKAVVLIGPKARTNKPRKEKIEEELGMRLHAQPLDKGDSWNLRNILT